MVDLDMDRVYPLDGLCETFVDYFVNVPPEQVKESISSFLTGIMNDERLDSKRTQAFIDGVNDFI